jgi:ketosteroid isomerase-like protein
MGPVQYQATYDPKDTIYHSHYFSVWQKKNNVWKVVLDKSIRYGSEMPESKMKYLVHSGLKDKQAPLPNIIDIDYSCTIKSYKQFCNDETIFVRKGQWPFAAKDSLPKDLEMIRKWKILDGQVASSGDFAYAYGVYELNNEINESGYFIRIWVYQNNSWLLRVDIHSSYKK